MNFDIPCVNVALDVKLTKKKEIYYLSNLVGENTQLN